VHAPFHEDECSGGSSDPFGRLAIVLREDNSLIGMCIFRTGWVDPTVRSLFDDCEGRPSDPYSTLEVFIGYALSSAHWAKGYATEAVRLLIQHAFTELKVRHVYIETDDKNARSMALMRRIGMRVERNHASDWQVVGRLENSLLKGD
jgi:RimJ/RimL family protein N-acetyltransferase